MLNLSETTRERLEQAMQQCGYLHASCISRIHLPLFLRVADENTGALSPIIEKFIAITKIGDNTISALFCLLSLADVNTGMKILISEKLPDDFIGYWERDPDSRVSNNAKILKYILNGKSLSNYLPKSRKESISNNVINIDAKRDVNIASGDINN